jgi:hypothetical protein
MLWSPTTMDFLTFLTPANAHILSLWFVETTESLFLSCHASPVFLHLLNVDHSVLLFPVCFCCHKSRTSLLLTHSDFTTSCNPGELQKLFVQRVWPWCRRGCTSCTAIPVHYLSVHLHSGSVVPWPALCRYGSTRHNLT